MAIQRKIGIYQHRPAASDPGAPEGFASRLPPRRRPFPFLGVVVLLYAILGPLVCAGVSALLQSLGYLDSFGVRRAEPLPPSPGLQNVLFGAGLPEIMVACAFSGWWLWRLLWRTPAAAGPPDDEVRRRVAGLAPGALLLGPMAALGALLLAAMASFLRTAPVDIPWLVRPLFAVPAGLLVWFSAMLTGLIPAVVVVMGAMNGLITALAVAIAQRTLPEDARP